MRECFVWSKDSVTGWMKPPQRRPAKFVSNPRNRTASRWTPPRLCTWFFSWPIKEEVRIANMSVRRVLFGFVLFSAVAAFCQSNEAPNAAPAPADSSPAGTASTLDQVVQRVVARERQLVNNMTHFSPVVETYIQNMREDKELGAAPESDRYFLGRLDLMNSGEQSFLVKPGVLKRLFSGV